MNTLLVRPDRNEFLLYAMLNALGQIPGNPDSHIMRRKAVDHFSRYKGKGLKEEDYGHYSKPVSYVLTIDEHFRDLPVTLDPRIAREVEKGRPVQPHLAHFQANTDIDDFYLKALPRLEEDCGFLQDILERSGIADILDETWGECFDNVVIPMPLEGKNHGMGPFIGDTAYQIVGPPFDSDITFLVAHEGSHPRAKMVLANYTDKIGAKSRLLQTALADPNYPNSYRNWQICFEEHMIRAVQIGRINPVLGIGNIEKELRKEEDKGMVFIRDFYQETKEGDVWKSVPAILERLDRRYRSEA